ncbi:MAG: hypothetical protein KGL39_37120, partial [Patescibacteria group bacterium]|nr:hypothetical protein [Patescibacteria group bacterium]
MPRKLWALLCGALLAGLPVCALSQQNSGGPNVISTSGSITSTSTAVALSPLAGQNACTVDVTGTWSGTLVAQASTSWQTVNVAPALTPAAPQSSITADGLYVATVNGAYQFRVTASAWTSGSATVYLTCEYLPGVSQTGGGTGIFSALTVADRIYDVRNFGWATNPYNALTAALASAQAGGGGCVFIPPAAVDPVLTGNITVPTGVTLCGNGFTSEFKLYGALHFSVDSGSYGISVVLGETGGNCSTGYGVYYDNQSYFRNTRFATISCSNDVMVKPNTSARSFDSFIGDYFENEGSGVITGTTLLEIKGSGTVVTGCVFKDTNATSPGTQALLVEGDVAYPQAEVSITGNTAYGQGMTVGDTIESIGATGYLKYVTYAG